MIMEKEFDPNDYQGRSEDQVRRNNMIFVITTGLVSLFGIAITLYVLFGEIF